MSIDPVRFAGESVDLSKRVLESTAVVASPAAAAETVIGQLTVAEPEAVLAGIVLFGWAAFTVGTSGTAAQLRLRRGGVAGTLLAASGAVTGGIAAAGLVTMGIQGLDTAPVLPNQLYSLTLQVTAGAAASTVSAVSVIALAI